VAITIRNKQTEAGIRALGRLRGEGPSAVISRLVEQELRATSAELHTGDAARRRKALEDWLATLPPVTEEDRREIDRAMQEMYDETGLPK
jgi:hypothetical protein